MLEPRWRKDWLVRDQLKFLGGTEKFDFWLVGRHTIRFVEGDRPNQWEEYAVALIPYLTADVARQENQEIVDEAILYLRLFHPDLVRVIPNC